MNVIRPEYVIQRYCPYRCVGDVCRIKVRFTTVFSEWVESVTPRFLAPVFRV